MFESEGNFENYGDLYVYLAVGTCFIAATLASAGGIGGGGIMLPILLVVAGFPFSGAITLSLSACLGNTATQIVVNVRKRHPLKENRSMINYDLVSILLPVQLGGAKLGFILEQILPGGNLLVIAMAILLSAGLKVFTKGLSLWKKESLLLFHENEEEEGESTLDDKLLNVESQDEVEDDFRESILTLGTTASSHAGTIRSSRMSSGVYKRESCTIRDEAKVGYRVIRSANFEMQHTEPDHIAPIWRNRSSEAWRSSCTNLLEEINDYNLQVIPAQRMTELRESLVEKEPGHGQRQGMGKLCLEDVQELAEDLPPLEYPLPAITRIGLFWIIFATLILTPTVLYTDCDGPYYIYTGMAYLPLLIAFSTGVRSVSKEQANNPSTILLGDLDFRKATLCQLELYLVPVIMFITGVLCSLLGIGGGELIGPTLLSLGMLPQVAGATCSFMASCNSALNVIQYVSSLCLPRPSPPRPRPLLPLYFTSIRCLYVP